MVAMRTLIVLAVIAYFVLAQTLFTVDEREFAVKFRFGEIIETEFEPGLHWKLPIVNSVSKFPKRILTINNPQELFLTNEKKNLFVDFFIKWRITEVGEYYRSTGGEEEIARQRLLETVKDGIRAEFAKRTVPEVVSAERRELMDDMLAQTRTAAARLGMDVVDVRVKRIEFSDEVSDSVFRRMREERARTAAELRAEGAENAEQIRANADRERTVILAEAYRDAEKLRGEGDALAAATYAAAYERNAEFYAFYRSIEAYRNTLGKNNDLLLLDAKGDFFRYLNKSGAGN